MKKVAKEGDQRTLERWGCIILGFNAILEQWEWVVIWSAQYVPNELGFHERCPSIPWGPPHIFIL